MRYELRQQRVRADYGDHASGNPLIDALPDFMDRDDYTAQVRYLPPVPENQSAMPRSGQKNGTAHIQDIYIPLRYCYSVYETMCRMITSTYNTRTSKENLRRTNAFMLGIDDMKAYGIQAQSGAILGTAGIGKSSAIRRSLALIPQVIEHERYKGQVFYTKQIIWLYVTCPADSSIKSFCFSLVKAIDEATGSNHMEMITRIRSTSSSALITYIKIVCLTYNIGLICVDEIQNLIIKAKRENRIKPLIRFLTELTNDSATAVLFTGTELAESVFIAEEYLRRRTRGLRLLPFKPDAIYRDFLLALWPYQYTDRKADLTDKLANLIYDLSGGIPAYISRIFEEAQLMAISAREPMINEKLIRATASRLAIQPPKTMQGYNWLSDFDMAPEEITEGSEGAEVNVSEEKRLYARKRGRRYETRDEEDLIIAYRNDSLIETLKRYGLLEVDAC